MVIVGKHVGGITAGPLEYLFDEGKAMEFVNEETAKAYRKERGSRVIKFTGRSSSLRRKENDTPC